jgi:5-methylcytosine-specific restriction endonuclease McrA
MTIWANKQPRIQLDPDAYRQLCRRVPQRDRWRCQACGGRANLQVHHARLRSRSGDDSDENLVTLCVGCHAIIHGT